MNQSELTLAQALRVSLMLFFCNDQCPLTDACHLIPIRVSEEDFVFIDSILYGGFGELDEACNIFLSPAEPLWS